MAGKTIKLSEILEGLRSEYSDCCLHELIAKASRQHPDSIAVLYEGSSLTYQELETRASILSSNLLKQGAGPEIIIPICLDRSLEMIAGIYGILKSGAAYAPIDPKFPQSRIDYILKDLDSDIGITTTPHLSKFESIETKIDLLNLPVQVEVDGKTECQQVTPNNLAYIIYTSGSTGNPKGACIEHRNIVSYIYALCDRLSVRSPEIHALASSIAADAGNGPIFSALTTREALHILSEEQTTNSQRFVEYLETYQPDTLKIVPSLLATLQGDLNPGQVLPKQVLTLGGESSKREWVVAWKEAAAGCEIFNHYGPTETTVGVATFQIADEIPQTESNSLPIGKALNDTQLYIVNDKMKIVTDGSPGELLTGGSLVGRGYLNNPEKTAESFIPDPFSKKMNKTNTRDPRPGITYSDMGQVEQSFYQLS